MNIESLLPWSEPKQIFTKNGPRNLLKAPATPEFWELWKQQKGTLKDVGISVSKSPRGEWEVCWWKQLDLAQVQLSSQSIEASRATDAQIAIPGPEGLDYLGYQKAGIAYAIARQNVLIADEMGLGKTIQGIGVINCSPDAERILIVCPANLKVNWLRECKKWFVKDRTIEVATSKRSFPTAQVVIINYDIVTKFEKELQSIEWDIMICDEAHYLKNEAAKRTQAILGHKNKKQPAKSKSPILAKRRVFLTGTPILNRPIELWTLVQFLDPTGLGRSRFGYGKRYCGAVHDGFGWNFDGASNLTELQARLRESCMVRRLKADVLKELPPKRRQIIELDIPEAEALVARENTLIEAKKELIETLYAEVVVAQAGDDKEAYKAAVEKLNDAQSILFTEISKIRHETALAKVPAVIEHIRECREQGQPTLVFAHHRDIVEMISAAFPGSVKVLGGSQEENQKSIDAFQNGETDVLVGTIKTAVGWTATRASLVIFAELDWVPGNLSQAEDRAHRIGQVNPVLVQHLVVNNSIDARLAKVVLHKQEIIEQALDAEIEFKAPEPTVPVELPDLDLSKKEVKEVLPVAVVQAIQTALRMLSGVCDGAVKQDDIGFNGCDSKIGKSLAMVFTLTAKQALLGKKILKKYRRQIPADVYSTIFPVEEKKEEK